MTFAITIDNTIIMGIFALLGYTAKLIYNFGSKLTKIETTIAMISERQTEIIDDLESIKKEKK